MYKSGWAIGSIHKTCLWTYEFEVYDFLLEDGSKNTQKHPDIWTVPFESKEDAQDFIKKELLPYATHLVKDCFSEETITCWKDRHVSDKKIRKFQYHAKHFLYMVKHAYPVYINM